MATISEALSIAIKNLQAGQIDIAGQIFQKILQVDSKQPDAWYNLAVIAFQSQDLTRAEHCLIRSLEGRPQFSEAHHFLGIVYKHVGRLDQAVASYRRTIELNPKDVEAHNHLGIVLAEQGKIDEAIASYRQAVALNPNYAKALNNLGIVLQEAGQPEEAVACYRSALKAAPNDTAYLNNLGTLLAELGRNEEAIRCYQRVLEAKPEFAEAHLNLGNVLQRELRHSEALVSYQTALRLNPDLCDAYIYQGHVLHDLGRSDEAFHSFVKALEISPDYLHAIAYLLNQMQYACRWDGIERITKRFIELFEESGDNTEEKAPPFVFLGLPIATTSAQQLRFAQAYGRQFLNNHPIPRADAVPQERKRLTVGFLSADFRQHPVAVQLVEMLEFFDRGRFRLGAYSFGPDDESEIRQRLVKAFDDFVDIQSMSHLQAAERIAEDKVDILVDLMAYTNHSRTAIIAHRPAPIQVNYLGYPGTMGLPFVDYLLADDYVIPPDQQVHFSEKIVYLPGCVLSAPASMHQPSYSPARSDFGLPESGFVFTCFNTSAKITAEIFECWMQLLKSVPNSVLWLVESNSFATANLKREAQSRGIPVERLVFSPRLSSDKYMARYLYADLFLDTPIYNGHSTVAEALKMGCPVLTISGQTFPSRVAASMLVRLGLNELITTTIDEYYAQAYRLACNAEELATIRRKLAQSYSNGFDNRRYTSNMESAFEMMWKLHTSGKPPQAFTVPASPATKA